MQMLQNYAQVTIISVCRSEPNFRLAYLLIYAYGRTFSIQKS